MIFINIIFYVIDDVTAFLIRWHQIFAGINYKQNSFVIYDVTAFLIRWHQIFAGINYRIDAVKQFVHVETIYLFY
jgi:hypothetical protein